MFFVYCYDAHRAPHSFPTRRSSDLVRPYSMTRICDLVISDDQGRVLNEGMWRGSAQFFTIEFSRENSMVDRKSTRLNSSHVEISYAVFCLKKKKTSYATNHSQTEIF